MSYSKETPFILLDLLQKYTDEDHILNTKKLISILDNDYEIALEQHQLDDIIRLLRDRGYKINTPKENGYGYYIEEHQFQKSEVLMLCNAIHSSNFISSKESRQLIEKLLDTLSEAQKKEYNDKVYTPNSRKTSNDLLLSNIAVISDAIKARRPVQFTYLHYNLQKKLVARRAKPYEVEPRFIVFRDSRAYLISTSDHHIGFANYRIDRISNISIINDKKIPVLQNKIDAYEYSKNMYFMFNDEQVNAVIRCDNRVLDHVIDIFGSDCRIQPNDDDHFSLHVKGSAKGLLIFAHQYLDSVEILSPENLRNQMLETLHKSIQQYEQ